MMYSCSEVDSTIEIGGRGPLPGVVGTGWNGFGSAATSGWVVKEGNGSPIANGKIRVLALNHCLFLV